MDIDNTKIPRKNRRESMIPKLSHQELNEPEKVEFSDDIATMQIDSMRELIQRQNNELQEIREFSNVEKVCFEQQLQHMMRINEENERKMQLLLQEKEEALKAKDMIEKELILTKNKSNKVDKENNIKLHEYIITNKKIQGDFETLKQICLQDIKLPTQDSKRLLAEASRSVNIIDSLVRNC